MLLKDTAHSLSDFRRGQIEVGRCAKQQMGLDDRYSGVPKRLVFWVDLGIIRVFWGDIIDDTLGLARLGMFC